MSRASVGQWTPPMLAAPAEGGGGSEAWVVLKASVGPYLVVSVRGGG